MDMEQWILTKFYYAVQLTYFIYMCHKNWLISAYNTMNWHHNKRISCRINLVTVMSLSIVNRYRMKSEHGFHVICNPIFTYSFTLFTRTMKSMWNYAMMNKSVQIHVIRLPYKLGAHVLIVKKKMFGIFDFKWNEKNSPRNSNHHKVLKYLGNNCTFRWPLNLNGFFLCFETILKWLKIVACRIKWLNNKFLNLLSLSSYPFLIFYSVHVN